jgi:hypothetical protein
VSDAELLRPATAANQDRSAPEAEAAGDEIASLPIETASREMRLLAKAKNKRRASEIARAIGPVVLNPGESIVFAGYAGS